MNPADPNLSERHLKIAQNTRSARLATVAHEAKFTREIHEGKYSAPEFLDFTSAISGDDLARIAAFEPKREPSLWSDVLKEGARHVRSAA